MDNPAQVRPEPALISAVVAVAVALAALALAVAVQRRAAGLRRQLRARAAQSERAADRWTRGLADARAELNRAGGSVAVATARLEGIEARLTAWTADLTEARMAATQLNERGLAPLTRLIRAVEIALQLAGLWRNPFG
jgi:L-serine deaminase